MTKEETTKSTQSLQPAPQAAHGQPDQQDPTADEQRRPWASIRALLWPGTIRTGLPISFVALVLLPVIVIGAMLVLVGSRNGRQQAFNQLESVARIKEAEVDNWLDNLQIDLESALSGDQAPPRAIILLQTPDLSESQEFWMRSHLQQAAAQAVRLEELFLVNLDGQVILSTDVTQQGKDHAEQTHFQQGLVEFYAQPPAYDPAQDRAVMIVARPVVGPEGKAVGVLAGRVNLATLSEIMGERAWLGDTGEVFLVDRNRTLLTAPRFDQQGQIYAPIEDADPALETQANGSRSYSDYRGVSVVGVYHWLPELQMALVAKQDESEALNVTFSMLRIIGLVALGSVAVAVGTSLLIVRSIAQPLVGLTETAAQIADGDLELVAEVEREDEIGALARAFNSMTAQLRQMLYNEQRQAAELQREVAERERLQQELIDAQRQAIQELSTPIIPLMDRIIVVPLIGSIDTMRARDITRRLLAGISEHRAEVAILDITGVPIVDSGVAGHLNKTVQAARLKGARVVVAGISDAVAETIVDLGIDWSGIETVSDLQMGLVAALNRLGMTLTSR